MAKPRKTKTAHPLVEWVNQIGEAVGARPSIGGEDTSDRLLKNVRKHLAELSGNLDEMVGELDPVRQPSSVFDPANPEAIGRVVALALLSQPIAPLSSVPRFYGSGIYALYFKGDFDAYRAISGKGHPIYVGKADPSIQNARTPMEQGEKLCGRLKEHFKSVSRADNLSADDFECRFLVVASGWQEAAERYLITLYRPVWNKETKICYGIGKHGDAATTRGNKRSPWDTMHSGRKWAGETVMDQIPELKIRELLIDHFDRYPPFQTREEAMDIFLKDMCQS
jgi:hypothetical protein